MIPLRACELKEVIDYLESDILYLEQSSNLSFFLATFYYQPSNKRTMDTYLVSVLSPLPVRLAGLQVLEHILHSLLRVLLKNKGMG